MYAYMCVYRDIIGKIGKKHRDKVRERERQRHRKRQRDTKHRKIVSFFLFSVGTKLNCY